MIDTTLCEVEEVQINNESFLQIKKLYEVQFSQVSKISLTIKNPHLDKLYGIKLIIKQTAFEFYNPDKEVIKNLFRLLKPMAV